MAAFHDPEYEGSTAPTDTGLFIALSKKIWLRKNLRCNCFVWVMAFWHNSIFFFLGTQMLATGEALRTSAELEMKLVWEIFVVFIGNYLLITSFLK